MVTWDAIECTQRNGIITVEFQEQGGARIPGEVVGQNFTASGLTPATHYTFQLAAVNRNGTGPFTTATIILTDEDSMLCSHNIHAQESTMIRGINFLHIANCSVAHAVD